MRKRYQLKDYRFRLIGYVLLLSILGVLFIGSADPSYQGRQLWGLLAGIILMILLSRMDYHMVTRFYRILYLLTIVLLALVLLIGKEANGATRWIDVGPFAFQPSDLAKLFLILYFSMYFFKLLACSTESNDPAIKYVSVQQDGSCAIMGLILSGTDPPLPSPNTAGTYTLILFNSSVLVVMSFFET